MTAEHTSGYLNSNNVKWTPKPLIEFSLIDYSQKPEPWIDPEDDKDKESPFFTPQVSNDQEDNTRSTMEQEEKTSILDDFKVDQINLLFLTSFTSPTLSLTTLSFITEADNYPYKMDDHGDFSGYYQSTKSKKNPLFLSSPINSTNHFINKKTIKEYIEFIYCPSKDNIADFLTKPLPELGLKKNLL
ncbi:hypothetical protein QOT17_011975 [Balamuthia mandrillaris]